MSELWLYYKQYPMSDPDGKLCKCMDDLEKVGIQYQMDLKKNGYRNPKTGEWESDTYCTLGVRVSDVFKSQVVRETIGRNRKKEFLGLNPTKSWPRVCEFDYKKLHANIQFGDGQVLVLEKDQKESGKIKVTRTLKSDITDHLIELGFVATDISEIRDK